MRLQQVRLADDAAQARRLQTLLSFKEQFISHTVAAQVIGSSGSDHSRIIYIDKGERAGIRRDMAVMTSDGIVGKVLLVYPSVSQVLLLVEKQERQATAEDSVRMRAADILAQRLPSVPDKPAGNAAALAAPPATSAASALATEPKPENKQPLGAVAQPAGSTAPTKPAAKTPRGTGASAAAAGQARGTNPSGTNTVSRTSPAPQPHHPPGTDTL